MGRTKRGRSREAPTTPGRGRAVALAAVVGAAIVLAVMTWRSAPEPAAPPPTPPKATARSAPPVRPPAPRQEIPGRAPEEYQGLLGEWVRPDGGYVLAVRAIDDDGAATVAYLNPQPINVERAEARTKDGVAALFVELRDRGYPGSTYTLAYDARSDQLTGIYFQATQRASYDVVFVRR